MNVAQPIWLSGCSKKGHFIAINEFDPFFMTIGVPILMQHSVVHISKV